MFPLRPSTLFLTHRTPSLMSPWGSTSSLMLTPPPNMQWWMTLSLVELPMQMSVPVKWVHWVDVFHDCIWCSDRPGMTSNSTTWSGQMTSWGVVWFGTLSVYQVNLPLVSSINCGLNDPKTQENVSESDHWIIQYAAGNDANLLDQFTDMYEQVCILLLMFCLLLTIFLKIDSLKSSEQGLRQGKEDCGWGIIIKD